MLQMHEEKYGENLKRILPALVSKMATGTARSLTGVPCSMLHLNSLRIQETSDCTTQEPYN